MAMLSFPRAVSAASVMAVAAHCAVGQVIDATWIDDTSDDWTVAARWSTPDFPTARGPDRYRAIIDFTGGQDYEISLATAIDLVGLRFTSGDATIDGGGTGTIVVRDELEFGSATVRAIAELMVEGTLIFTGASVAEIDDTPLCVPEFAQVRKTGLGAIRLSGTTVFDLMADSTFTIESSGDIVGDASALLRNDGTLIKQSAGPTAIDTVRFENTGTVIIEQGTLSITNPVLPFPSTLGPATYDIGNGAVLDLPNTFLDTNQADVIFRGSDSAFPQFGTIGVNQGLVQAEGGADVFFSPTGGLTNDGALIADGAGSTITTGGAIDNNGGTITVIDGGVVAASNGFGPLNNNGGTVQGTGTIQSGTFINNGTVSPGNSPGVLVSEVAGMGSHFFEQGPAGTLVIEIGGRTPGLTHDVLDVRGIALFDGTLDLQFSPFVGEPQIMPGDQFEIILAEGIDGIFRDVQIAGLGSEAIIDVQFGSGAVIVIVREVPAPGALAVLGLGGLIATRRRR